VDDGSDDDTAKQARAAGAEVLSLPMRRGKGRALREGLARALSSEPRPSWIVFSDGDGQHRPEELPRFLELMNDGCSLLLGSRMGNAERFPSARRAANVIGTRILRLMTGAQVPDTQCGYRAIRADLAQRLELESDGFEIETEMLLKSLLQGARWKAVPVSAVYNGERSHYRPVADTFRICMAALRYVR
jgi:glycosyltransferase involved in cell wall biosynthesis